MRKLPATEKCIALKQMRKIANKTEANGSERKMFLWCKKNRYFKNIFFLGLVINLPFCFRFREQKV